MTPEQKSIELIDKFMPFAHSSNEYGKLIYSVHVNSARQCAMVCVKQLLSEASGGISHIGRGQLTDAEYWQAVLDILKKR